MAVQVLKLLRTTLTVSKPWCTSVTQQALVSLSDWQLQRLSFAADGTLPPAFVFDIDGVLIRGNQVLDPARRALAKLYSPDGTALLLVKPWKGLLVSGYGSHACKCRTESQAACLLSDQRRRSP